MPAIPYCSITGWSPLIFFEHWEGPARRPGPREFVKICPVVVKCSAKMPVTTAEFGDADAAERRSIDGVD